MSGTNASIPLQFGYGPDMGAAIAQGLGNAQNLIQLQQVQQQIKRANALRGILGAPDAIDPATGMPKTDTISKVMSVDPQAGIKLGEFSVQQQARQLEMNSKRSKAGMEQAKLLNDTFSPVVLQYEEALKPGSKISKQQADMDAQKAWTEAREELVKGGLPPEVAQNIPTQWNYQDAKRRAMASDVYLTNPKQQEDEARQKRLEKHDELVEGRIGTTTGTLADGTPVIFKPNAPPGQRVTFAQSGQPVPEELLRGAHKMGAPGASGATLLDQERIKRATQFAYEQELGHPVSTEEEKATLDQRILDAEAKQKQAARGTSSVKADQERIAATTRFAYEKELGHPVDPNNPEEKNELDARILAAEDKRKAETAAGVTTARKTAEAPFASTATQDRAAISRIVTSEFETQYGHTPQTPGEKVEFDRRMLAAEDNRKEKQALETAKARDMAKAIPPDVSRNIAEQYVESGNPMVLAGFRRSPAMIAQIEGDILAVQKERGMTPQQVARQSAEFAAYTQGLRAFEAGGKLEPVTRSLGVATGHLGVLGDAAEALQNGNMRVFNELGQWIAKQTGQKAPTDFDGVKRIVATELFKAVAGSAGAFQDRESIEKDLDKANSPTQLRSLVDRYKSLMAGQLNGLRTTYDRLGTGKDFDQRFLSEVTRRELSRAGVSTSQPAPGQGAQPTAPTIPAITNDAAGKTAFARLKEQAAAEKRDIVFMGPDGQQHIIHPPTTTQVAPAQPTPAPSAPATAPSRPIPAAAPAGRGTQAAPLPLPKTEDDLVDRGIYASDKGVVRFDKAKKRFFPVGGQ